MGMFFLNTDIQSVTNFAVEEKIDKEILVCESEQYLNV